jgi:hypothetical protein
MKPQKMIASFMTMACLTTVLGVASAECAREFLDVGSNKDIECPGTALGQVRGDVAGATVSADLLFGTQLDAVGVDENQHLVNAGCRARDTDPNDGQADVSRPVCIPEVGHTYAQVLAVLFDD